MKALLLENIHSEAERVLSARGFEVETRATALSPEELTEALSGVNYLGIRSTTDVPAEVLDSSPELRAIGAFCIGTNQIDLAAASRNGVAVFNAPYSNTRSVVELAIAEVISLSRGLTEKNCNMHAGLWDKSAVGSHEVRGRTLGIIGYGNIGSQLSVLAEALGMRVLFFDIADRLPLGNARRCDTLVELLGESDIVSLHVDGRAENAGFFGANEFAAMRPKSHFINLCRGHVVDHEALHDVLASGHLAGAAIDVFPSEPKKRDDNFGSVLQHMPNVILTPHVGGSTLEAQEDIGRYVAGKLADYDALGSTSMSVNLPDIPTGSFKARRIVHLHHNVPGVMAGLNRILANSDLNIGAQSLATRGQIGYAITDVEGAPEEGMLEQLRSLDGTIRVRVLP